MLHYLSLVHSVEHPNDYYSNTDEIELRTANYACQDYMYIAVTQQAVLHRAFSSNLCMQLAMSF